MHKHFDKKQSKQKKQIPSWLGFLVIIIFAVVVFGGAFVWQYFTIQEATNIEIENKTIGWKKYTNIQYGFEIKYPKEWVVEETKYDTIFFRQNDKTLVRIDMGKRSMENSCNIPFSKFIHEVEVPAIQSFESLNSITIVNTRDNTEAYKTTWNYSGMCPSGEFVDDFDDSECIPGGVSEPMTYIYNKNDPCSDIVVGLVQSDANIYDIMISTFKFTK